MASHVSLLVPSRVLVNRCIASCVLFLYVGSLHAAILDEVIVPSSLDPMIEYITGNLDTPTPITPVALEIPEATRSALDDRDMTIAQVDDTVVVTTSTGVTLDDTTLSGAIAEVTVAIAADTEIISEDR